MTEANYSKPLPSIGRLNKPFWDATREFRLELQFCCDCGEPRYPISHVCPNCLCDRFDWRSISGRGTVLSTIVFHQAFNAAFSKDVPYNVSLIQLAEGPRMFSNVIGIPPSEVRVGDEVEVVFDLIPAGISIPKFQRTSSVRDDGRLGTGSKPQQPLDAAAL